MPWWETIGNDHVVARMGFWSVNPGKPGMDIDPGGRVWSEVIGCGLGWPHEFFSEKVVDDLEDAGIDILRKTEMPIASNKAKTLLKLPAPKYFVLEAERGIEADADAMGVPLSADGKRDWKSFRMPPESPIIFNKQTWNGKALFAISHFPTCTLFCTGLLKDLAEQRNWRNVRFKEIGYMK